MNPSTAQATVLVDELIAGGVTDAVLCPGSRSAPLAFALHAADAAGRLRLHVRIDERGAGFLALGLARASGRPVAVATTSGTAVANLHPAVLEAHHGGVPLVVLSADRPPHLHGVGANQVVDQRTIFGSALRFRHDFAVAARRSGQNSYWRGQVCRALAAARGVSGLPGPVQLNVPFDVPLVPGDGVPHDAPHAGASSALVADEWPESLVGRDGPWTTIAGPAARDAASVTEAVPLPAPGEKCLFLADLGHPWAAPLAAAGHLVISESGGLAGAGVLAAGMLLLADEPWLRCHAPERVVVLGRPTLFRAVTALLARQGMVVDVVDRPERYSDVAGAARIVSPYLVAAPDGQHLVAGEKESATGPAAVTPAAESAWHRAWRSADAAAGAVVQRAVVGGDVAHSAVMAAVFARSLPDGAAVFVGSSQPPRDLARVSAARSGVQVVANRGVAGIDGCVSTAVGAALARQERPTYALLGDLTFLHDVTALAIGPHEPRPDLTIVVANNDGGGIFHALEQGDSRYAGSFERIFGTPTGAQLAQLADGFGVEHVLVTTADELADEVRAAPRGLRIVEVPVGRTNLRDWDGALAAAVREALADLA